MESYIKKAILIFVLGAVSNICLAHEDGVRPRVLEGMDDAKNEYPFVVALYTYKNADFGTIRFCSGALFTERWVLTAAHCIQPFVTKIRYGDLTVPANSSSATYSEIKKSIRHPGYRYFEHMSFANIFKVVNDIGLLLIDNVPVKIHAKLSAVEYSTMIGYPVKYAGYGWTFNVENMTKSEYVEALKLVQVKKLQTGVAVVKRCQKINFFPLDVGPFICVAAKCSKPNQRVASGDSGSPLFLFGKIIGVASVVVEKEGRYIAVSPFLDWIHSIVNDNDTTVP